MYNNLKLNSCDISSNGKFMIITSNQGNVYYSESNGDNWNYDGNFKNINNSVISPLGNFSLIAGGNSSLNNIIYSKFCRPVTAVNELSGLNLWLDTMDISTMYIRSSGLTGLQSTGVPTLYLNPQPNYSISRFDMPISWTLVSGQNGFATGYRLDVSTNNNFSIFVNPWNNFSVSPVYPTIHGSGYTITGLIISPVITYHIRIRPVFPGGITGINSVTNLINIS